MRTFRALLCVWLTVLALALTVVLCGAQSPSTLIRSHPLLQGLTDWWRGIPGVVGGNVLYNLIRRNDATLVNFTSTNTPTNGWNLTDRLGGTTHLAMSSAQYLTTTLNAGVTYNAPFTLCVWAYAPVSMTQRMLITTQNQASPFEGIVFAWSASSGSNESIQFDLVSNSTQDNNIATAANTLPLGRWVHICATYDGSQTIGGMQVFMDSQLQAVTQTPATFGAFTDHPWTLGAASTGGLYGPFNGNLDDWRVWNRALSVGEISQVYNLSRQGDQALFRPSALEVMPAAAAAPGHPGSFFPFFGR